jgi:hypothetical protein
MAIFSEIDKKVLGTLIVIIVVILLLAFVLNQYTFIMGPRVNNITGGAQTETK